MNLRDQQVLKILMERYLLDGAPVSSKIIAEESALGLSSATIRHILADLEETGYLTSLHTSSGRVPTVSGYRLFIESLLTVKPLDSLEVQTLINKLNKHLMMPDLLQSASSILSGLTKLIAVVTLPKRDRIVLRQVEFLPLTDQRILVVMVLNNHEVQNRLIHTERAYSQSELQQVANYLNAHYVDKDLAIIRRELLASIEKDRDSIAYLTRAMLDVLQQVFAFATEENKDCLIAGQDNLLTHVNQIELEQLRSLFAAFTQKQEILSLLDQAIEAQGIQILIGKESGYTALNDWSIVSKSYSIDGEVVGTLGVIGPTRMPYDRVISAVDATANLLSAALNQA